LKALSDRSIYPVAGARLSTGNSVRLLIEGPAIGVGSTLSATLSYRRALRLAESLVVLGGGLALRAWRLWLAGAAEYAT
jgi:hypothetical protein